MMLKIILILALTLTLLIIKEKVITEKRGIYTNPPKKGTASTPG